MYLYFIISKQGHHRYYVLAKDTKEAISKFKKRRIEQGYINSFEVGFISEEITEKNLIL